MKNKIYLSASIIPFMLSASFLNAAETNSLEPQQQVGDARTGDLEEIVVTGTIQKKSRFDILQSTNVISGKRLEEELAPTLGETLDHLPGLSSSSFGPGSSRPVVRGLSGDRVRILIGGVGSIDASSTSPDHAVSSDTLTATSVEVLRGPATLLYGSNAVGGVINVLDGRIPFEMPANTASGAARLQYGTNSDEMSAAGAINFAATDTIAIHLDASLRDMGDMTVPGYLESKALRELEEEEGEEEHSEEEAYKVAENTSISTESGAFGISNFFEGGFIGASVSYYGTNYGIPGHHGEHHDEEGHEGEEEHGEEEEHEGEEEHGEEDVRIDLEQIRFDVMGEYGLNSSFLEKAKFRFGIADYEHVELEGEEVGTTFLNDGWEGRVEFVQRMNNGFSGAFGLQAKRRVFEAIGAEAFVPKNETEQFGLFGIENWTMGNTTLEGGIRLENTKVKSFDDLTSNDYTGVSISGGASYKLSEDSLIGTTIHRSERAPNAEELFSNGPHLATQVYELGNDALGKETAIGGEVSYRFKSDALSSSVTLFYNKFNDFIYQNFTGAEEDELPVAQFSATDARFWGVEAEFLAELYSSEDLNISIDTIFDFVKAKDTVNDAPLPRTPPMSVTFGTEADYKNFNARAELTWNDKQDEITAYELPTDSYVSFDLNFSYRPMGDEGNWLFMIQGKNLTNEDIRHHTSFLKDMLPSAGRDVRFAVKYTF